MKNERFATEREIKDSLEKASNAKGGGPVLWIDPKTKEVYILDSESNLIFLGVSGAGKTRRGIVSMILTWIEKKENFIVVDPKGDLHYLTWCFAKEAGYEIHTINYRDTKNSDGVNILYDPYVNYKNGNIERANYGIQTITHSLIKHGKNIDPFWPDSARSLVEGIIYILFEYGKPDQINMLSVIKMISDGFERVGSKKALEIICDKNPDSISSLLLQNALTTASDTLGGIRSVAFENLSNFVKSPGLIEMMSSNDLSIGSLDVQKPTAIYIMTPDENSNYAALTSIVVSQIADHYIQLAHEKYNGRLPRRVNICIEELGNLGENGIPNLDHLMSAGRSRNIRTSIVLQSLSQLHECYGKSLAETITSNADTIIAYRIVQYETLEELSRKCGERAIDYGNRVNVERLIEPSQIGAMETGRVLIMASGRLKYSTVLPDFTEIYAMDNWNPPKTGKQKRTKPKVFDLKALAHSILRRNEESKSNGVFNPFANNRSSNRGGKETEHDIYDMMSGLMDQDIDKLIAHIDQKIAELDEDDKQERQKITVNRYHVIVTCEENKAYIIANLLANKTPESRHDIITKLCHHRFIDVVYTEREAAEVFAKIIINAGGNARIESE